MEAMKQMPDKAFELAIVDPPYGSAMQNMSRTGGTWAVKYRKIKEWDFPPAVKYFDELFRVSRNSIIWGGNYFSLPSSRNFIVWKKLTISESFTMASSEIISKAFEISG